MTTFDETNGEIHCSGSGLDRTFYAACTARGRTWVGPLRATPAAAKRDAVRHHDSD